MKNVDDLLHEARQSIENMSKPGYDKKAWFSNFYYCMERLRFLPKDKTQREQFRNLESSHPL